MVRVCAFPRCFNRERRVRYRERASSGGAFVAFHKLPLHDSERLYLWLVALRMDVNAVESLHAVRVCSEHFSPEDYRPKLNGRKTDLQLLKSTAVPAPSVKMEETEEKLCEPKVEPDWGDLSQSPVTLPDIPPTSPKCSKSPPAVEVSLSGLSEDEVDAGPPFGSSTRSFCDRLPAAVIPVKAAANSPPGLSSESSAQKRQRKRRHESIDHVIMKRLEAIDQRREELQQLNDEDTRFAFSMADILHRLPPHKKSLAKFKIHQLLFHMKQAKQE
ncbi:THAP domain-containing protein 1-like [Centroberyx affinis]|uniref:THAP domain-containing protein 1-like n=1 Tax=Centroberyx affinis TaxID=166261 RepID=UPI003A5BDF1B